MLEARGLEVDGGVAMAEIAWPQRERRGRQEVAVDLDPQLGGEGEEGKCHARVRCNW